MKRYDLEYCDGEGSCDAYMVESPIHGEYVRHDDVLGMLAEVADEFDKRELGKAGFLLRDLASALKGDK